MGKFKYQAVAEDGRKTHGVASATSIKTAMAGLVEQGLDVTQLRERRKVLQFEITKKKLKQDDALFADLIRKAGIKAE